ncbi:alpha/beta fold hydrolase [Bacillus lacus]|uniref:Alpha/beta fold hydrolase n=1 Tax=Metabacillus lacus TaxID=1983721 RepID=A0A7X2J2S8_9BACI|nr:alpha/beta hydrolase [Metabacillus lacus]MRX74310.1 alpha/beta fold hydrolase [Metabacillus lacus]
MRKSLFAAGAVLSYVFLVGFFFTNKMMYIKKRSVKEIVDRETEAGHFIQKEYDEYDKTDVTVPSPFGYNISGYLIAPHETKKYMIICHGVTVSRVNSVKYMKIFLNRGYNVLIYDHRSHGESGGSTTSYGHYEKYDLQAVVNWLRHYAGSGSTIGVHGESMGAVTALLYAGIVEDGADFYIADCPFADLEEQLLYRLKVEFNIPPQMVMPIAKRFLKLRDGYSMESVSPVKAVENIENPVLFIHSTEDDYIPSDATRRLHEKKVKGFKQLYFAKKGTHAMSYTENRKQYEEAVDGFLERVKEKRNRPAQPRQA